MRIEHSRNVVKLNGDGNNGLDGVDGNHGSMAEHDGSPGGDASAAQRGSDGEHLELRLYTDKNKKLVHMGWVGLEEHYRLSHVPTILWSSRGGSGGNGGIGGAGGDGSEGMDGVDETFDGLATNGQGGGNGGNGGSGSNGANGGDGGDVNIIISEEDTYLLTLLEPCQEELARAVLSGGSAGTSGKHGPGGRGGRGGAAGKRLPDGNSKQQDPPQPGNDGADGLTPVWELLDGSPGKPGSFQIEVVGEEDTVKYSGRYEMEFVTLQMKGKSPMASPREVEFGDVVTITDVEVKNIGKMPLPSAQKVLLQILDCGDPNVTPFYPHCFIREGTALPAGASASSTGELKFFAGYPVDVEDLDDFDPIKQETAFKVQAFQAGPTRGNEVISAFQREYRRFHRGRGVPFTLRYPIENRTGLHGVASLYPGEETMITLELENVGSANLGGFVQRKSGGNIDRRLALKYRLMDYSLDGVPPEKINFSVHENREDAADVGRIVDLGSSKLFDLETLKPSSKEEVVMKFSFHADVSFYRRSSLLIDILLETLPFPAGVEIMGDSEEKKTDVPPMSVIQRRKIEIVCEPKYEVVEGARVVLVTSVATTQAQYRSWSEKVLTEMIGIPFETFSVSRYGTLKPDAMLENGMTIKEAFRGKLVILLTDEFKPNQREKLEASPLHMLDHGVMQQTSLFDPTTRWLVVGARDNMDLDLLDLHLSETSAEGSSYPDMASYEKFVSQFVSERKVLGRQSSQLPIREDTISVTLPAGEDKASKKLRKIAEGLREWLRQTDPLCQYSIEYDAKELETEKKGFIKRSNGEIKVRRGFCRSKNSAVVVAGSDTNEPDIIESDAMLLSIAEAMDKDMRVSLMCDAIRKSSPSAVMTAYKYASVSDLIRDESTFLDCKMKMNDDLELSFPSVGTLLESVEILQLIRDCKSSDDLHARTTAEFSDLIARFELVANSKDLRPRFSIVGRGKKKTTHEALMDIVERLRVHLKAVMDRDSIERTKKLLKEDIKSFLKADLVGSKVVNVRADQRWIQGLNYMHSTENETDFGELACPSKRLIEMDIDDEVDNYKIIPPSVRVYSSVDVKKLLDSQEERKATAQLISEQNKERRELMVVSAP